MIQERGELLDTINSTPHLLETFSQWEEERREEFLDFCTGTRGIKILYDTFFKEIMNPEYTPERIQAFLKIILKMDVKVRAILPNDTVRIADETSLLITDIIVELDDGSVANVEVQKVGYYFPGERSACYSADMLLRQYKRVHSRHIDKRTFSYREIKNVYLVVLFEKSPAEFRKMPSHYIHHAKQVFDTKLELNLLQEYIMIPLDIFKKSMENKSIETPLEAWLTFFSSDVPDRVIELIEKYPEFQPMYETLYHMCLEVDKVMSLFSEELKILDQNTVRLMIEEQQRAIEEQQRLLDEKDHLLESQSHQLDEKDRQLDEKDRQLDEKDRQLEKYIKYFEKMGVKGLEDV